MGKIYKSTCHCGAVELQLTMPNGLEDPRRCDCSICSRKGTIMTSVVMEGLQIVKGADKLTCYQFNTMIAEHYFCSVCGIYTHHRRRSDPSQYAVNVACIDGVDIRNLGEIRMLDGRTVPAENENY